MTKQKNDNYGFSGAIVVRKPNKSNTQSGTKNNDKKKKSK